MTTGDRAPRAAAWSARAAGEPIADGTLRVDAEAGMESLLAAWRPRAHPSPGVGRCHLHVGAIDASEAVPTAAPEARPLLEVGAMRGWIDDRNEQILLRGRNARGRLALSERAGRVDPAGDDGEGSALLLVASGVLLATAGQLLVHAGATVAPDGRAWLLVGDAWAGKSTTVLTLVRAGWGWLSDDTVALAAAPDGGLVVHAWARTPHVDAGWERGRVTGTRGDLPAQRVGPGPWTASAPLGGLLFPRVEAGAPTALHERGVADAFIALVRQAPWAVVSRRLAVPLTALTRRAAEHPAFSLRLGADSYGRPGRLTRVLAPAVGRRRAGPGRPATAAGAFA